MAIGGRGGGGVRREAVDMACRACGATIGADEEYWQDGYDGVLCLDCGAERLYGVTG